MHLSQGNLSHPQFHTQTEMVLFCDNFQANRRHITMEKWQFPPQGSMLELARGRESSKILDGEADYIVFSCGIVTSRRFPFENSCFDKC